MTDLTIRHVLFPYDFSPQAEQAAAYVGALARQFEARVTLFSVLPAAFDAVPAAMAGTAQHVGERSVEWRRALQCQLEQVSLQALHGLDVQRVADCGDPALRIVDFAHDQDIDLVIMPTHGL